ncbi:MAG: hypothetical protein FWG88_04940 [Oscillospiraceae bacterium]|nr:hypothetical protein [Oscillospiraceae bacterium]
MLDDTKFPNKETEPNNSLATEQPRSLIATVEEPPSRNTLGLEIPVSDNLTVQQRSRDEETTTLYKQYVNAHKQKQVFSEKAKRTIHLYCILWVSAMLLVCFTLSFYVIIGTARNTSDIVALLSAIIPLVAALVGTLNIVTKYVFPEDEERNITEIVKQIHENDLRNKQENLKR